MPLEGKIHSFTVCNYGGEEFLTECPYILVLVEFKGVDTLFLSRLLSDKKTLENQLLAMDAAQANQFLIGRRVKAEFKPAERCQFKITDVYFRLF